MKPVRCRMGIFTLFLALAALGMAQQPLTLSGTIANPTGERVSITAWGGYFDEAPAGSIASGTVEADGSFSLELPATLSSDNLQEADINGLCSDGGSEVRVTPESFPHAIVNFLLAYETTTPIGAMLASSTEAVTRWTAEPPMPQAGDFLVYILYVPSEVSVQGHCIGSDGTPMTYDLNASAGWSYVQLTFEQADGAVVARTVKELPEGAAWQSPSE